MPTCPTTQPSTATSGSSGEPSLPSESDKRARLVTAKLPAILSTLVGVVPPVLMELWQHDTASAYCSMLGTTRQRALPIAGRRQDGD